MKIQIFQEKDIYYNTTWLHFNFSLQSTIASFLKALAKHGAC